MSFLCQVQYIAKLFSSQVIINYERSTCEAVPEALEGFLTHFSLLPIPGLSTSQKNSLRACKISFAAHCRGGGKDAIIKTEGDPTLPHMNPQVIQHPTLSMTFQPTQKIPGERSRGFFVS